MTTVLKGVKGDQVSNNSGYLLIYNFKNLKSSVKYVYLKKKRVPLMLKHTGSSLSCPLLSKHLSQILYFLSQGDIGPPGPPGNSTHPHTLPPYGPAVCTVHSLHIVCSVLEYLRPEQHPTSFPFTNLGASW